jgi:hypothetical protein
LRLARRLLGGVLPTGFGIFRGERRDKVNGTMVRKESALNNSQAIDLQRDFG